MMLLVATLCFVAGLVVVTLFHKAIGSPPADRNRALIIYTIVWFGMELLRRGLK